MVLRRLLFGRSEVGVRSPRDPSELGVRAMRADDREHVLRIETASPPNSWNAEALDRWLAQPRTRGYVLERGGERVGFFIVLHAIDHIHLANLAVAPAARRTGVATTALRAVENIARHLGLQRVELEVRETNLAAQLLYRRCGYRAVEIVRSYYGDQDAYKMTKTVAPVPLGPTRGK
jgi:ribosomal-protein-alanine N-acetyltransferase